MVIRVVLADDQPLMLQGLDLLLRAEPGLEVFALATDGNQALTWPTNTHPTSSSWTCACPG